jgi:repressor LexA
MGIPVAAHMTLTAAQERVLTMIRGFVAEKGYPPSRTDICDALGYHSPNAAQEILAKLETKGFIEIIPKIARGIKVL